MLSNVSNVNTFVWMLFSRIKLYDKGSYCDLYLWHMTCCLVVGNFLPGQRLLSTRLLLSWEEIICFCFLISSFISPSDCCAESESLFAQHLFALLKTCIGTSKVLRCRCLRFHCLRYLSGEAPCDISNQENL